MRRPLEKQAIVGPHPTSRLIWLAAVVLGCAYFLTALGRSGVMFEHLAVIPKPIIVAWKGAFTVLLAASVCMASMNRSARLISGALAISAVADMLLVTVGIVAGGMGFAVAHALAILAYVGYRSPRRSPARSTIAVAFPLLMTLGNCALLWSAGKPWAIGMFVLLSSSMAASALLSRFPIWLSGLGAMVFVLSDALFFADLALFGGSGKLGWLTWACYATGYALVARGAMHVEADPQS
ncbi:MAG: hypothetical protein C0471_13625 [Erythrobacter sp.]|nr:hypothetical protein [Erythrobacter sp.]